MNRKIIVYSGIVILLILLVITITGGFFIFKEAESPEETKVYSKSEDYEINGQTIENSKFGLSLKMPEGWKAEGFDEEESGISLLSPEFTQTGGVSVQGIKASNGCSQGIEVYKYGKIDEDMANDLYRVNSQIEFLKTNKDNEYELIQVSGKTALKRTMASEEYKNITVEVPVGNNLYYFDSGFIFSDKCEKAFNDFLSTVEIK